MSNAAWNRAVAVLETVGDALLLGSVMFTIVAVVFAIGTLLGG